MDKAQQKRILDKTAEQLRTKMLTYVDELLASTLPEGNANEMSHKEALLGFETFKVETASRKVLQELLEYFNRRDIETFQIVRDVRHQSDLCTQKVEQFEKVMRKLNI
jgi:hypothetical protein